MEMQTTITTIPVSNIISTTDRKYGGEGNIETLAQSIKLHGLIQPLAVKEIPDKKGSYQVIAGRRRYEAVKFLNWKNVEAKVYPAEAEDEAIALAENVNREDMHPLDEAENFRRQIEAGKTVEEVAKYYARSVSGINQRIRLGNLIDGLKTMFRDGKINLSAAALIASLPESDQDKFLKKYGERSVDKWEIGNFLHTVQKLPIKYIADETCTKCKMRTFNTTPGLFEEYEHSIEDICFDGECYAVKWKALIAKLIAEQSGDTDNAIIINRGIPDFFQKKSKVLTIDDTEYTMIPPASHNWEPTKKKGKANTAWLVSLEWHISSGSNTVQVSRVTYKKYERPTYSGSNSEPKDPVKKFMIDLLPEFSTPEEKQRVAAVMEKKHKYPYGFFRSVKEVLFDHVICERLEQKSVENPVALYLAHEYSGEDKSGKMCELDPDYEGLFTTIFGKVVPYSELPKNPFTDKLFTFILATSLKINDMPELNDDEAAWAKAEHSLFWKFAQVTRERYIELYKEILTNAIVDAVNSQDEK